MGQIAPGASVYLDANILIRITEGLQDERNAVGQVLAQYVEAGAVFVTSELSFTEVLVHPMRQKNQERLERYQRLLSEFVTPLSVSREVLLTAAKLRAETPALRTPDAIHVATALLCKASVFLTGDRGIKSLPALRVEYV